jgi:hypothetical protein
MERLGTPPMPWQRLVLDTAYELDPATVERDGSGDIVRCRLWYREVRVTIQRQGGKTTKALGRHVHRHLRSTHLGWGKRPVTLYTAQSASAARDKLVEEWAPVLEDSPYIDDVEQVIRSNGRESIRFIPPGGRLLTVPPTRTGGHGITGVDMVDVDEAFAHRDATVEQGVRPTMITRVAPQIYVTSTAGTVESEYLWGKVDDGRRRCETQEWGSVAYFEWAAPDDAPLNELPNYHPAVGYTISREALLADIDSMDPDEARRAYGNIWTTSVQRIIPAQAWAACLVPTSKPRGRLFLAVDSGPGSGSGRTASIAVAGTSDVAEGRTHVEVIDHAPGLSWVAERVANITQKHRDIEGVYIDPTGPIASIVPDIERSTYAHVYRVNAQEMAAACQRFHEDALNARVAHIGQDALDSAVEGAAKRDLADSWAWTRRRSSSDVSPLVAVTLAYWGAVTHPDSPLRIG